MHYFSPVPNIPLLEITRHAGTSDDTAAKAADMGLRQGKTAIVVKDVPGFYVNRCLGPYIAETLALVSDGVEPAKLDKLITKWGLPVGPITLADEVGLDAAYHVNQTLSKALGPPKGKNNKKTVNANAMNLVKKFQKNDLKLSDEDTLSRLISRFVNEAVLCVQDYIIASPTEGDIGAVFGIGSPPFIGGPFRYVDKIDSTQFTEMMQRYADKYVKQFTPVRYCKIWPKPTINSTRLKTDLSIDNEYSI
ncbi:hypothetical protein PsorP6_015122 [Peronosclerospora sorghi]|uniref:Uncharacterized protein n=1 Tax=Peronosclerospora sorghi TaxID=230839 RepID=A0ACC0VT44_9STRA|nr:hypothetical protein PsorP6_015122 [Peronosclerospora sorghi]